MNKWYQEIIVLNKEIDGSMFYCFDEENYKKISDEREGQLKEIERLNSIIKEVREYLQETINKWEDYEQFYEMVEEDKYILGILDKTN